MTIVIEDHMIVGYDFRFLLPTHCLHYDARDLIYDRKAIKIGRSCLCVYVVIAIKIINHSNSQYQQDY